MERSEPAEPWPITREEAEEAKSTLKAALEQNHPELRCGLGVYVVNHEYKVAIRLRDEGQEALAAELAERYIPGIPLDIEHSGPLVARALKKAVSGQIIRRPDTSRPPRQSETDN